MTDSSFQLPYAENSWINSVYELATAINLAYVTSLPELLRHMKFQVGDKVVVNQTNEEGEVIDIINEKMVMVEVRGVKFPAYIDQLDFPYFKRFTEKKIFPKKKKKIHR